MLCQTFVFSKAAEHRAPDAVGHGVADEGDMDRRRRLSLGGQYRREARQGRRDEPSPGQIGQKTHFRRGL